MAATRVLRIAPSLCNSLRRTVYPLGYRCFVLDNSSRGVKAWEKNDKDNNNINAVTLGNHVVKNLETCGYSKCSELNKVFDNVKTVDDLHSAEEALLSFRKGYNPIRPSTPRIVVRACIRVNKPNLALHFIKHKVQYGIFPTVNIYNVLMDAFLKEKQYKKIVDTYQELLKSELQPNAITHKVAVLGYMLQENTADDALETARELCDMSLKKNRKIGITAHHILIRILQDKDDRDSVTELLAKLETECSLYNTHDVNWRLRGYLYLKMVDKIYNILDTVCDSPVLKVSKDIISLLQEELSNEKDKLQEYKEILFNKEKLI